MILGLLSKLINFALLSLAELDQFDTFPGWVGGWVGGGAKLRLKTTSAQLKLKLGLSLAIKTKSIDIDRSLSINDTQT